MCGTGTYAGSAAPPFPRQLLLSPRQLIPALLPRHVLAVRAPRPRPLGAPWAALVARRCRGRQPPGRAPAVGPRGRAGRHLGRSAGRTWWTSRHDLAGGDKIQQNFGTSEDLASDNYLVLCDCSGLLLK